MKREIPPAWGTAYDGFGDAAEEFKASREGLFYLKSKIDEALEKGEASIGSEANFDFLKIVVADIHPTKIPESHPVLGRIMGLLGLSVIALFIIFAVYGCHSIFEQIKK